MRARTLTLLLFLTTSLVFGQSKFSEKEVLDDLDALKNTLEETHYNLFAYTSKNEFNERYQELKNGVSKDSLSLLETTNLFQKFTSSVNNGHTWIEFPIQSYMEYAENGGTVFPLELAFENKKALIRKNWSGEDALLPGMEIITINGVSIANIVNQLYPQISAEREYFKNAKIELYSFPRLYWQVFGETDEFSVTIKNNNSEKIYRLKAVPAIDGYEMKRDEVINATRQLDFFEEIAYLRPGGFGGDKEKYLAFIDSSFSEIKTRKSKHLILDLRNNPGGDDSFSDYLVSFLADRPFQWNSKFSLKTSSFLKKHIRKNYDISTDFWQKALSHEDGEIYDYDFEDYQPQPTEKRFYGAVYVLVNRQSHSQATVTAAQLQDYGFATVVGEETAEYPTLFASIFQFTLPNTGIAVNVSKGRIVRVNGSEKQEGVQPDIMIKDHLLDETDEILEGLKQQIGS
ncbi:S41 family peptidase [Croceivirga thetidis]|uniref:Peptidase S41 n=1 Tax=Croceivirga thetidis TaxID=2721623 RepID=A0ABX1GP11_9FLAO|nr:S41 family peptidase [Croceivirga thetidis]NKI30821.1 peptidase S41 [Croceivirga thetidis]